MLPLQRLEYVNTVEGVLAVEAVVATMDGGEGTSLPSSVFARSTVDLVKLLLHLKWQKGLSLLTIEGDLNGQQAGIDIPELVLAMRANGIAVRVRIPGTDFPGWASMLEPYEIEAYIESGPWLQFAAGSIVYVLDREEKPEIARSHLERRTPLWVFVKSRKALQTAWAFVVRQQLPWRLLVEPKYRIKQDLKEFGVPVDGGEL